MKPKLLLAVLLSVVLAAAAQTPTAARPLHLVISGTGKPISPDLFGIFFEDLSYAADGGLYAELVQNRSFEYSSADKREWNALTAWMLEVAPEAKGRIQIEKAKPLNEHNPHYAVVDVLAATPTAPVSLQNAGYDGIAVTEGELLHFSVFVRENALPAATLRVRLLAKDGRVLAEAPLSPAAAGWHKQAVDLTVAAAEPEARLALDVTGPGSVAVDMVSLFPAATFRGRSNGLRVDLAETIAALRPHFMRFPGGCLVHGDGLGNTYRWQDTIGPVEARVEQPNIWQYHQSVGLGYFEFFQFAEDVGAKPLPVVSAGVSCQNSGAHVTHKYGVGQQAMPLEEMPSYIKDVLDLIEFANGPKSSRWGAKRAAAGHPAPFGLQYIGIGNEDAQTDEFRERFKLVSDAVHKEYPGIKVIGTVGPSPAGDDYDKGWRFASQIHVPMVDEHMYEDPAWFWSHRNRYDSYDRSASRVYIGEYAAHETKGRSTLRAALAEAAFMTSLERNGDVVRLASYAPLLRKQGHSSWDPDLIYFSNTWIHPSVSYYAQRMFSANSGDTYLATNVSGNAPLPAELAISAVTTEASSSLVLKLVNGGSVSQPLRITLPPGFVHQQQASVTLLRGALEDEDGPGAATPVLPVEQRIALSGELVYTSPPFSIAVVRIER